MTPSKKMPKGGIVKHDISKAPNTGNWRYMKPEVYNEKCVGCGTCVQFCPEATIDLKNKKAAIDYDWCKGCGVCSQVCPVKAILMKKN